MTVKEATSYVCGEPFAWADRVYVPGRFYAADDPGVLANPGWFAPYGTPDDQLPRPGWASLDASRAERDAERAAEERRAFENEAKANPVKLAGPELVKATADHYARLYGRPCLVRKGSVVTAEDDLVSQNPDLWKGV